MFLACQGMAMAGTFALPQADATAPAAPCHDAGGDAGNNTGGTCPAQCQFQNATSTPAKLVYAAADLPAITIDFASVAAAPRVAPPPIEPLARIEPPPLRILNCCLRN